MQKPRTRRGSLWGISAGLGKLHLRLPHGAMHGVEIKTPGTLRASGGFDFLLITVYKPCTDDREMRHVQAHYFETVVNRAAITVADASSASTRPGWRWSIRRKKLRWSWRSQGIWLHRRLACPPGADSNFGHLPTSNREVIPQTRGSTKRDLGRRRPVLALWWTHGSACRQPWKAQGKYVLRMLKLPTVQRNTAQSARQRSANY